MHLQVHNNVSFVTMGKASGVGDIPKCQAMLGHCISLGPLVSECPHHGALPYTKLESLPILHTIFHT